MIPFLGLAKLFSNPLTKYLGEKVIGHFEHKAEVLKNERMAEIEASKSVQIQQVKSAEKSWKDEYLTIVFTAVLVAHFIPQLCHSWHKVGNYLNLHLLNFGGLY
jgi:hypothetical protein